MASTKTIVISAAGITTLLGLFIAMQMAGLQITSDGDKLCSEYCEAFITVKNPTANTVYVTSEEAGNYLTFSPDIERFELYLLYYGKWKLINFSEKGTLMTFPRYTTKELKLAVWKRPDQTIKWSFGSLDPYFYASYVYDCDNKLVPNGKYKVEETYVACVPMDNNTCINYLTNYSTYFPEFEEVCEKIKGMWITILPPNETKYIQCLSQTCSIKNNILTLKYITRGGNWKDPNLDECYNQGVPCSQYNLSNLENWNKIKEIKDKDGVGI